MQALTANPPNHPQTASTNISLSLMARFPKPIQDLLIGWLGRRRAASSQPETGRLREVIEAVLPSYSEASRQELLQRVFSQETREALEAFRSRQTGSAESARAVSVDGMRFLADALKGHRGAILLTSRFGSWRGGLAAIGARSPGPVDSTGLPVHSELHAGGRIPSGFKSLRQVVRHLQGNGIAAVPADCPPEPSQKVFPVRFLGRTCTFTGSPVRISYLTGAPILPWFSTESEGRTSVEIEPPIGLSGHFEADLQSCLGRLESRIYNRPDLWLNWRSLHLFDRGPVPRFKSRVALTCPAQGKHP